MVFNGVPACQKNKFPVFAFPVNSPSSGVGQRSNMRPEVLRARFESNLKLGPIARLDEISTDRDDRRAKGRSRG